MDNNLEFDVNGIVKFVTAMFSPDDMWVKEYINPGKGRSDKRYSIVFYFSEIDEKYMTNPQHRNPEELKEAMYCREIRTYINDFLGIKTSGLQPPDFWPPAENHPISIYVRHTS